MNEYFVYMLANKYNNVLYTGVTNNIRKRVYEHKMKVLKGFTNQYNCNKLVWYEQFEDINLAIAREKQLKNWKRAWKNALIEINNPNWNDLAEKWFLKSFPALFQIPAFAPESPFLPPTVVMAGLTRHLNHSLSTSLSLRLRPSDRTGRHDD